MNEPELNKSLSQVNLFNLFRLQLIRDFETAGFETDFLNNIPSDFFSLRELLANQIKSIAHRQPTLIPGLLYRIDVSEKQTSDLAGSNPDLTMEEVMAELIIKRILQKVILKKTFSGK
ncbi:MAG TPA: hypothetical protein PLQ93_12015 [Bacteroidia bacterium]|nr:hypothetical protein [Bacteroidia bacterium]